MNVRAEQADRDAFRQEAIAKGIEREAYKSYRKAQQDFREAREKVEETLALWQRTQVEVPDALPTQI
ncbi:MAG: hypothetical protein JRE40_15130 [Deltaproteobacteria bacterium]|nr:hypothetical protein [Deltaproteobacteria bacterium]